MMEASQTRPAVSEDLPRLAKIWATGWRESHSEHVPASLTAIRTLDSFHTRLENMLGDTIATGPIGLPTGFVMVKGQEFYQLYIAPEARGTGAARALMAAGEARIRENGHKTSFMYVIPQNPHAIAVYTHLGWEAQSQEVVQLDTLDKPFPLECVVMTKNLVPFPS